jgi:hypothetical protein
LLISTPKHGRPKISYYGRSHEDVAILIITRSITRSITLGKHQSLQLMTLTRSDTELVSMQARIHIPRAEETALGIKEEVAMEARADFHLLNSDDFPHGVGEQWIDSESIGDKFYGKQATSERIHRQ